MRSQCSSCNLVATGAVAGSVGPCAPRPARLVRSSPAALLVAAPAATTPTRGATATPDDGRPSWSTTVSPITSIAANVIGDLAEIRGIVPEGTNSHTFEPSPSVSEVLDGRRRRLRQRPPARGADARPGPQRRRRRRDRAARRPDRLARRLPVRLLVPRGRGQAQPPPVDRSRRWPQQYARHIADTMVEVDPDNADAYEANQAAFVAIIDEFDAALRTALDTVPDGEPQAAHLPRRLRLLGPDLRLEVIGAIQPADFGDPTPKDVADLIDQVRAAGVPAIFGSEVFPSPVLDQIADEAGATYVDDLRDDDLPGEPGDDRPQLPRADEVRLRHHRRALGGDAAALEAFQVRNVGADDARVPAVMDLVDPTSALVRPPRRRRRLRRRRVLDRRRPRHRRRRVRRHRRTVGIGQVDPAPAAARHRRAGGRAPSTARPRHPHRLRAPGRADQLGLPRDRRPVRADVTGQRTHRRRGPAGRRRPRSPGSSTASASATSPAATSGPSPVGSSSGCSWPARCCPNPICSCSTSPRRGSTSAPATRSSTCLASCTAAASASCSPPTTSTASPPTCPDWCASTVGSSAPGRPHEVLVPDVLEATYGSPMEVLEHGGHAGRRRRADRRRRHPTAPAGCLVMHGHRPRRAHPPVRLRVLPQRAPRRHRRRGSLRADRRLRRAPVDELHRPRPQPRHLRRLRRVGSRRRQRVRRCRRCGVWPRPSPSRRSPGGARSAPTPPSA